MQEAAAQPRGPALETPGQIWLKETMQVLHNGAECVGPLARKEMQTQTCNTCSPSC
jgi:hypothetical protein